jgi:hypothetical protein
MDFNTLKSIHQSNPAISALSKKWLPLAISFLYSAFKSKHEVSLPQEVFREQLDAYIEYINTMLSDDDKHRQSADDYINRWSREDDMIRIRQREDGYIVQLSPHAERLIAWFEEMQNTGMIGTESRLRNILSMLDEVVTRSTEDVEARLRQLYDQRDKIDEEIAHIERTQEVDGLSDVQIRERLNMISSNASQLLRDFSMVEEKFRDMARTIQQAQLDPTAKRGDILGTTLDADEQLENSDEGLSFRAFYELLTYPTQREQFDDLLGQVFGSPRLGQFSDENAILKRLTSHLLDAGERVNQSNRRLAEHLRRVVDTRNVTESRRVQALARDIKHRVSQLEDDLAPLMIQRTFMTIEGDPLVDLPMERPLYEPTEQVVATERPRSASTVIDTEMLVALYDTFYIDESALKYNIERLLMSHAEFTLAELVNSYPITQGMVELVAYVLIAAGAPDHSIQHHETDVITLTSEGRYKRSVTIPRLIFRRPQQETEHVG